MLQIQVLGQLRVMRDGAEVYLRTAYKPRLLLATLLARADQPVSTSWLMAAIWGDDPPPSARKNIQQYAQGLRNGLGADILLSRRDQYTAVVGDALDATRFATLADDGDAHLAAGDLPEASRQFRAALKLWAGPAFAEFTDCPHLQAHTAYLNQRRLVVYQQWARTELDLGRHTQLVPVLSDLVLENPFAESLSRLLILALYRSELQTEALKVFHRVRTQLADELGLEPGAALQQLHLAILRNDPLLMRPAMVQVVPRELPAYVPDFIGRAAALQHLDSLAGQPDRSTGIVVIAGIGGVGKTALAVHWAHRMAQRFPDGQLYINLQGYSQVAPIRTDVALAMLLTAMGLPEEQIPRDTVAAAARFRSLMADRRVLIVLDDARSAEQIRPLLPASPACLVLVTSRDRLSSLIATDGAKRLTLEVLSEDESLELLSEVVGPERISSEHEAAISLTEICGGLPLALRVAAAQLADNPFQTVSAQVSALKALNPVAALILDGKMAISAALDLSYRALPPTAQLTLRRLGLIAIFDFTAESVARLADISVSEATSALDQLTAAHLVFQHKQNRYTLHDLVRHFACWIADAADSSELRREAIDGFCRWYLLKVSDAEQLLYPHRTKWSDIGGETHSKQFFRSPEAALQWLNAEQQNLAAIVFHIAKVGPFPVAWRVTGGLSGYYQLYQPTQQLDLARAALAAARTHGDELANAVAYHSLACARVGTAKARLGIAYLSKAARLSFKAGWMEGAASASLNLARVCTYVGNLHEAADWAINAIRLYKEIEGADGTILATNARVRIELARGNVREALNQVGSDDRHRRRGSPAEAQRMVVTAETYSTLGQHDEALTRASDAFHHGHTPVVLRAEIHLCLSGVHLEAGDFDLAHQHAGRALEISHGVSSLFQQTQALTLLAEADLALGDVQRAVNRHTEATQIAESIGHCYVICAAQIGIARAHVAMGELRTALGHCERALTHSRRVGYRILQGRTLTELTVIHRGLGSTDLALDCARLALSIQSETGYLKGEIDSRNVLRSLI